jgi:hypothetical protein
MPEPSASPSATRRLLWFVALWGAGVAAVGGVGLILRFWLRA